MKIYIDKDIKNLNDLLSDTTVIDITDLQQIEIDELLKHESVTVVASGQAHAQLVSQLVNSRPNQKKPITLVQTHPNLTVLVDKEGAQFIL